MTRNLTQRCLPLLLALTVSLSGHTQDITDLYPRLDKEIPDFAIRNMQDLPDSILTKTDVKGKFVLLFFWSKLCSACVKYFPGLNAMHEQYGDQVTFVLIGTEDKQERMRPIFEKVQEKLQLDIPFAFDSVLFNKFVPQIVPHLIWIDNRGMVRAITDAAELNHENIRAFLRGERFTFHDWSYEAIHSRRAQKLDINQPFLRNGNGGTTEELTTRSVLVPFQADRMAFTGFPMNIDNVIKYYPNRGLLQGCAGLEKLYRFAYTGYPSWFYKDPPYKVFDPRCVLNVRDTSPFDTGESFEGFYWYSLLIPEERASATALLKAMQNDLEDAFGYVAKVETRRVPCWVITSSARARRSLKASGRGKQNDHIEPAEVILSSTSMDKLIGSVFYLHTENQQPIINKTKIKHSFDVNLSVDLYDFNDIRRALQELGLHVKERKQKMKVIVISDPEK